MPLRAKDRRFRQDAMDGADWLRKPGPNCEVVLACQGAVADEVFVATGMIGGAGRDIGVMEVTLPPDLGRSAQYPFLFLRAIGSWSRLDVRSLCARRGSRPRTHLPLKGQPPHSHRVHGMRQRRDVSPPRPDGPSVPGAGHGRDHGVVGSVLILRRDGQCEGLRQADRRRQRARDQAFTLGGRQ